jgi:polysaccharide export outer membrane protein
MVRAYVRIIACAGVFLWCAHSLGAASPQKTTKELIDYIQQAKKLGLKDPKIRQNALAGGWDKTLVDEAFAIVKYLSENPSAAAPETAPAPDNSSKNGPMPAGYRIGAGDTLQIVVWKEPDFSVPTAVVRADGKISIPLIKDVEVLGLTPAELEKTLAEKLKKFILDADVTVVVRDIKSLKVYLLGAVKKEGPIPLQGQMMVLQAINEGGGLTDYAKRKKIYILRNDNGKQIRFPFDYEAVIRGEQMDQNIVLRAGDMIVVPQ